MVSIMISMEVGAPYSTPVIPITERIIKPGINAEKERDTEAGTLSGKADRPKLEADNKGKHFCHHRANNNPGDDIRPTPTSLLTA